MILSFFLSLCCDAVDAVGVEADGVEQKPYEGFYSQASDEVIRETRGRENETP